MSEWIGFVALALSILSFFRGSLKDYMPREPAELRLHSLEQQMEKWSKRWHDEISPTIMAVKTYEWWKKERNQNLDN